jgi:hypothetical protein
MDTAALQTLKAFYEETKGHVDFIERATSLGIAKNGDLIVTLEPVGLVRRPKTVQEAKVLHVLLALKGCGMSLFVLTSIVLLSHGCCRRQMLCACCRPLSNSRAFVLALNSMSIAGGNEVRPDSNGRLLQTAVGVE